MCVCNISRYKVTKNITNPWVNGLFFLIINGRNGRNGRNGLDGLYRQYGQYGPEAIKTKAAMPSRVRGLIICFIKCYVVLCYVRLLLNVLFTIHYNHTLEVSVNTLSGQVVAHAALGGAASNVANAGGGAVVEAVEALGACA